LVGRIFVDSRIPATIQRIGSGAFAYPTDIDISIESQIYNSKAVSSMKYQ
jgi:hypothetical protein